MDATMPPRPQHAKPPDSEKLTINLGFVDLGSIDLLVQDNFYSNRSDFIRTAIRNQLATHADTAKQAQKLSRRPPAKHAAMTRSGFGLYGV